MSADQTTCERDVATATDEVRDTLDFLATIGGGSRAECEARVRYAAEVAPDRAVVELGVMVGQGLCCLACGARFGHGAHVFGIDLFGLRPSGQGPAYDNPANLATVKGYIERFGLTDLVTVMQTDTLEAALQWDLSIGLLVVDAGHEYEQVLADVRAWLPYVVPGGLLLMHDAKNPAWPGVDRVIAEQIMPSGQWEEAEFVPPFSAWYRRAQ